MVDIFLFKRNLTNGVTKNIFAIEMVTLLIKDLWIQGHSISIISLGVCLPVPQPLGCKAFEKVKLDQS